MRKFSLLFLVIGAAQTAGAQSPDPLTRRIDSVFARYTSNGPGCAAGVYQDGKIRFEKGYGLANIEFNAPITPTTPFLVGSVSKQFTAAAAALLIEDGKLSPDDDIRKYVSEIPDYGKPIRVRDLIHHTSGLRDWWTLVEVAGMRNDDTYAVDDVLHLAARQRHLSFDPGAEYAYSNTGYIVLGVIVQRVSGKSLAQFAAERIFGPLGMTSTHFHDDHTVTVRGRAAAYSPTTKGDWRINIWNNDIVGQGGVMTTLEDLLKWDENFYTGKVGGKGFLARQLKPGMLSNGQAITYAYGLQIGEYRGLPIVDHSGSTGGYRAVITRYPTVHTSFVALCNVSTADPSTMMRRVADVVLANRFTQPATTAQRQGPGARQAGSSAPVPMGELAKLAGRYYSEELEAWYDVSATDRALIIKRPRNTPDTLIATDSRTYRSAGFTFHFASNAASFTLDAGRARGMEFVRK
jgi:CubicO group peptidase (beta-lactamase class C family)